MPAYVIPPAGVSAASFFVATPVVDAARPPAILADDIDPNTGELRSLFSGQHPVDAAVAYQCRIKRGSGACVLEQGQRFSDIKKNDSNAVADIRFEALRIFKPFIERGDVEVETIQIQAGESEGDLAGCFIEYANLRNGTRGNRAELRT